MFMQVTSSGELMIENERGRRFRVDLLTRFVTNQTEPVASEK